MVINGHTATYSFFASIIQLGLFQRRLGIINQINLFLGRWGSDVTENENKKGKNTRNPIPKNYRKTRYRKSKRRT